MKLANETELVNTRRKLAGLQALIRNKDLCPPHSPAYEASRRSLKRFAEKLADEIREFEQRHESRTKLPEELTCPSRP